MRLALIVLGLVTPAWSADDADFIRGVIPGTPYLILDSGVAPP
jgi:hypothetical protein